MLDNLEMNPKYPRMIPRRELRESVLQCCLDNIKDDSKREWFQKRFETLNDQHSFFLSFGMVNRKFEESQITMTSALQNQLKSINSAFSIDSWTLVEFCRLAFLLFLETENRKDKIIKLLSSADRKEQVLLYKSFQFLANAAEFQLSVIDGIRTNMIDVFDAIALEDVYPFKYFGEDSWNHMVLKAIFMERPLYKILGLDERSNSKLAGILQDFAHERWAAGRAVTPELWRLMSGFLNDSIIKDLHKVIETDSEIAKLAAIKVLEENNNPETDNWLRTQGVSSQNVTWDEIGERTSKSSGN
ncbi:MAG: hypothetical protein ACI9IP_002022 [Arcticibacterium sp.]|jgi:hypothetical protein